jgi:hypothetical protein
VRLVLYVSLKNICDGVGGQDESNGTPLDPPLFWLDNIFNALTWWITVQVKEKEDTVHINIGTQNKNISDGNIMTIKSRRK